MACDNVASSWKSQERVKKIALTLFCGVQQIYQLTSTLGIGDKSGHKLLAGTMKSSAGCIEATAAQAIRIPAAAPNNLFCRLEKSHNKGPTTAVSS